MIRYQAITASGPTTPLLFVGSYGVMYGRGVDIDKGARYARLAVRKYIREHGSLPVNIIIYDGGQRSRLQQT